MILRTFVFLSLFLTFAFAGSPLIFEPEILPLGEINQGESRRIVLKGKNLQAKDISLETVMSLNTGAENFKYPQTLKAGQSFTIEFDLNTAYKEGIFSQIIVLVDSTGKSYTTQVDGVIKAPILFSEKMFDLGYYSASEFREWTFYVWNPDKEKLDLKLSKESSAVFTLKSEPVMLNVVEADNIKEGGDTPGLRMTLRLKKSLERDKAHPQMNSIRHIVSFQSKKYPKATPEVLIIGYWK